MCATKRFWHFIWVLIVFMALAGCGDEFADEAVLANEAASLTENQNENIEEKSAKVPGAFLLWDRTYNGTGNDYDHIYDIAVDDEGNVYVTGRAWEEHLGEVSWDSVTICYDTDGARKWTRPYSTANTYTQETYAIALDNAGYNYVAGTAYNGIWESIVIKRTNDAGTWTWIGKSGCTNDADWCTARDVAVDDAGNVYVTGDGDFITEEKIMTVKYNAAGARQWLSTYAGYYPTYPDARGNALALDSDNDVIVVGHADFVNYYYDMLTMKYDGQTGDLLWASRRNGSADRSDYGYFVEVDSADDVIVAGSTYANDPNRGEIRVIKYDGATGGDGIWSRSYNYEENGYDSPTGLAVDGDDNVFITGRSWSDDTGHDWVTIKYNGSNGNTLWVTRESSMHPYSDYPHDIVVDDNGDVYVVGRGHAPYYGNMLLVKYDGTDGAKVWEISLEPYYYYYSSAGGLALDAQNNIYIAGSMWVSGTNEYDYLTAKIIQCDGCWIDDTCLADGAVHPDNSCLWCDSAVLATDWSVNDGASCDDGDWCNGDDTCLAGVCDRHQYNLLTPRCPDDGDWCNGAESCDETADQCVSEYGLANPRCTDDGLWCDGEESCDEINDRCVSEYYPDNPRCVDDGDWCDGEESCDEDTDQCVSEYGLANPRCTDDGLWCNGEESCDETDDRCVNEFSPDNPRCADDGAFCNGDESCDEDNDLCFSAGDPCDEWETCNEETDICDLNADDDTIDDDTADDDTTDDDTTDDDTTDDDTTDDDTTDDDTTDDDTTDDDDDTTDDDDNDAARSSGDDDSDGSSGCGC